jgi:hypothetical protein
MFENFDKKVDIAGLKSDIEKANENQNSGEYPEIPKGQYEVKIKSMEVKATKDGRPMLSVGAQILEGKFKNNYIWMNRVLFGTKNDANMISSAVGWLMNLGTDTEVSFEGYQAFADLVLDLMEEIDGSFEYLVDYDADAFNTISIKEVFEV